MAGLISIYTSLGLVAVLGAVQIFIMLYIWWFRRQALFHEEQLSKYSNELEACLDRSAADVPLDFFSEDISGRRNRALLKDFIRTRCTSSTHRHIGRIKTFALGCGLTGMIRADALAERGWNRAVALRLLAVISDASDTALFRRILEESRFKPEILAAAIGLANSDEHAGIRLFMGKLYDEKHPNRDEVLSVLYQYYHGSVEECAELIGDKTLPLQLRATLVDFIGVAKHRPARAVLEGMLGPACERDMVLHVIEALEKVGAESSCELILPYLDDQEFRVRLKAVNALERLAGSRYMAEAERLLSDPDVFVRRNAAEAVSRMGPEGIARLESYSRAGDSMIARVAKMILAEKKYDKIRWRFRYGDSIA